MSRLRQSEYTGENRCAPCTVVNLLIAAAGGALVSKMKSRLLGTAFFIISLGIIYLRGYLVPGTPTLTKRYFPEWILELFNKRSEAIPIEGETVDSERWLIEAGAITECEDIDDVCLEKSFRQAWQEQIYVIRDAGANRQKLAHFLGVTEDQISFDEFEDAFTAHVNGSPVGQWESETAYLADLAAADVLDGMIAEWDDMPVANRSQLLSTLRLFLDSCPSCGEPLRLGEETVESCCRSMDVVAVTCQGCNERIFEAEMTV